MPLAALKLFIDCQVEDGVDVATTLMPLAALKPDFFAKATFVFKVATTLVNAPFFLDFDCILLNAEVSPGEGCREIPAPLTQGSIIMYENRHPSIAVFWYT